MNHKKRSLCFILVFVLAFSCLVSCGANTTDTENTQATEIDISRNLDKDKKEAEKSTEKTTEKSSEKSTEQVTETTEKAEEVKTDADSEDVPQGEAGNWGEIDQGDPNGDYGYYEFTPTGGNSGGENLCMTRACSQEAIDRAQSIASMFGGSDYEKVRGIHDYIVNNCYYNNDGTMVCHSADGILLYNYGVCESYTNAFNLICYYAGISTAIAFGNGYMTGDSVDHCWSLVELDGVWYQMDVTWDDPVTSNGTGILRYDYFLITEATMSQHHTISYYSEAHSCTDNRYEIQMAEEQRQRDEEERKQREEQQQKEYEEWLAEQEKVFREQLISEYCVYSTVIEAYSLEEFETKVNQCLDAGIFEIGFIYYQDETKIDENAWYNINQCLRKIARERNYQLNGGNGALGPNNEIYGNCVFAAATP